MEISSLSGNLPHFKWVPFGTNFHHEDQPTPYPTHSLELSTSENSAGGSFGEGSRCRRMTRRFALLLLHRRLMLAFRLRILKQRAESILSANRQRFLTMLMLQLLCSFGSFLRITNLSLTVQKWCLKQCSTRLNHECTQQDLIYLCKDQLCTQRFKL
ncbi:hypothetical protein H5410_027420 [Solanum commersonii]|uniref:Uncharacterized protein n=1 Tax=Solanum commersonii TaxID=4109 RepID=A0A9J5Z1T0_SOLCO|nr:hypothetical protein H5410_027420 [Solanum commersonii]